jgi:hypothetical protein
MPVTRSVAGRAMNTPITSRTRSRREWGRMGRLLEFSRQVAIRYPLSARAAVSEER